jgi:hypothetical protein
MREAFPPCLPITNSSGIENNNNNHKELNYNHTTHTTSNNCHKGKDLNIDRNNETTKEIPNSETEKICFDSDEGKSRACLPSWRKVQCRDPKGRIIINKRFSSSLPIGLLNGLLARNKFTRLRVKHKQKLATTFLFGFPLKLVRAENRKIIRSEESERL